MTDKAKRDAAVDGFAAAVKARLDAKAAEGYTGWDGAWPEELLLGRMTGMVDDLNALDCGPARQRRIAVDVGALAMMLWFRSASAAAETK